MVKNSKELVSKEIKLDSVKEAYMKVLVGKEEGWEDHVMRLMEVGESGYTPKHQHPWPHINYMVEGKGELMINGVIHEVEAGSYAFVPSDTIHQFRNVGTGMFKFICIVPSKGHTY